VVAIFGDGAFGLHAMELEAMARQKLPVVCVIGNDAAWTQIRRGQVQIYGEQRAVATELSLARYDKVAEALGCFGVYVERSMDLEPALEAAFAACERDHVPAVVNVRIGKSDFRKGALSV
jgi:acetolactate synthase-1/2/3 large subunit